MARLNWLLGALIVLAQDAVALSSVDMGTPDYQLQLDNFYRPVYKDAQGNVTNDPNRVAYVDRYNSLTSQFETHNLATDADRAALADKSGIPWSCAVPIGPHPGAAPSLMKEARPDVSAAPMSLAPAQLWPGATGGAAAPGTGYAPAGGAAGGHPRDYSAPPSPTAGTERSAVGSDRFAPFSTSGYHRETAQSVSETSAAGTSAAAAVPAAQAAPGRIFDGRPEDVARAESFAEGAAYSRELRQKLAHIRGNLMQAIEDFLSSDSGDPVGAHARYYDGAAGERGTVRTRQANHFFEVQEEGAR